MKRREFLKALAGFSLAAAAAPAAMKVIGVDSGDPSGDSTAIIVMGEDPPGYNTRVVHFQWVRDATGKPVSLCLESRRPV